VPVPVPDLAVDAAPVPDAAATDPAEATAPHIAQIDALRTLATERDDLRGAIKGLERLRKDLPDEPTVHYALGNTYAENQAYDKAVASYLAAIRRDAAYRNDPRLVADVVEALGSRSAYRLAEKVITSELADTALPRLEEASRSTNRNLRARARKLRSRLR
jgi:tetratricopeptide (TPR) repeat protein